MQIQKNIHITSNEASLCHFTCDTDMTFTSSLFNPFLSIPSTPTPSSSSSTQKIVKEEEEVTITTTITQEEKSTQLHDRFSSCKEQVLSHTHVYRHVYVTR